jgi:3-dehydroquinate synthase
MIRFEEDTALWMKQAIEQRKRKGAVVALLTDQNTRKHCFPVFQTLIGGDEGIVHITIPAGEASKNIESLERIWDALTSSGAGRDALLICLGGGMITDIGGFAASTYKRGIDLVHVPTSLLGMVDAAIGGKTGIDFQFFKNHLGTFYQPEQVLIFSQFLLTLPERQIKSGFAEVVKYALINGQAIPSMPKLTESAAWKEIISFSACLKLQIVQQDPTEKGLRKVLNFGHTIGHALEAHALETGADLLHGEAVAAGMLSEVWLSVRINGLDEGILQKYSEAYFTLFEKPLLSQSEINALVARMRHDKKNSGSQILFVLLDQQGKAMWDVPVDESLIIESLNFLNALSVPKF